MNPRVSTLTLLAVLLFAVAALHHEGEHSDFKTLLKQQTRFEYKLTKIEKEMALTMNKLSQAGSTAEKVNILEGEISRQRQRVFSAAKVLIPKHGKCQFEKLTADQRQSLINELENIRASILKLQGDLNSAPVCDRTRQMYLDLNNQLFYIDSSQAALREKCGRKSIISATIWQTNLNAQNWILGDQTLDDVIEEYYQRSITYDNITNCDIKTPFFSEGKCINCEPKLPIFDLYRGRCVRCSNGFVFDGAKRACVVGAAGEVKKCPKGTYFDAKSSSCVRVITCSGNQFFNGTSRLCQDYATCDGKWLNKQTNECVDFATCEDGKWLDKNNNECIALLTCPEGFTLNKETNQCDKFIICNNMYFNKEAHKCEDYVKCDTETEFLDRSINKCEKYVQCTENQQLNKLKNQCIDKPKCEDGKEFYNAVTNKCDAYTTCPEGQFLRKEYNRCEPFVPCKNGILNKEDNTCKNCADGEKLDEAGTACVPIPVVPPVKQCEKGLLLNTDTKTCVQGPVLFRFNENATNIIQGKTTFDNYQLLLEKAIRSNTYGKGEECPADKPFSLLTSCTACEGSSFILDSQACGNCPEGSEYSTETKNCKVIVWISDETAKFDLGGATLASFTKFQAANVAANPHAVSKTCAKETPYSNAGTKCTKCEDNQAWDPATNACKQCDKHNAEQQKCE
jgi:hypothetical protein